MPDASDCPLCGDGEESDHDDSPEAGRYCQGCNVRYGPPVAPPEHLSPVRRTGRLLLLLRQPRTLEELQAELGVSPSQLRLDLRELREEGWPIEESAGRGRTPKHLWLTTPIP